MGLAALFSGLSRPPRPSLAPFPASSHPLAYPLEPVPRTAVFGWPLAGPASVRYFPALEPAAIEDFLPQAIAAPLQILITLADARRRGIVSLARLSYPIVVFSDIFSGPLSEGDRDRLWRDLGLPVFEQWRGWEGELLARECDAHQGLHIQAGEAAFERRPSTGELLLSTFAHSDFRVSRLPTGLTAVLETGLCACGDASPRLVRLTSLA